MSPDPISLTIIVSTFLLAGTVKGVIGLGLPTVSLGLLTVAIDLSTAMALLLVPSLVTNTWQAVVGGNAVALWRRLWPFLVMATGTIWIGALALTRVNVSILSALLGVLLVTYAMLSLTGVRLTLTPRQDGWAGPLLGAVNGLMTGMTGSFAVPGVMYLQSIGLPRDMLIQAMGMLFLASTVGLGLALEGNDLLPPELAVMSAVALVPAALGMVLGQTIRKRLSETVFRRAFFLGLLILGAVIVASAIIGWR